MSSTYSPDLRIELIGPGDQAGTWGTTTNTNLGTLIEDAIAGYATVSVTSADQAFTALDGAADQARNAIIALTTTTTANFAVYAPPASKQYIIYNTTAYTATIYNSTVLGNTTAAGLGVAVPAGSKLAVFSNGTNFRSVDAPGFVGVLPVANGGTGLSTTPSNGTLLIGNGSGFSAATLTAGANVTITNGAGSITIATTSASAPIPSGTVMLFVQSSAPTGWTKSVSHDNKALRVVNGSVSSGGSVPFSTAFSNQSVSGSVGSTTLSTSQMPFHNHSASVSDPGHIHSVVATGPIGGLGGGPYQFAGSQTGSSINTAAAVTGISVTVGYEGSSGSHNHSFFGTSIDLAVQYVDVIIATAN
jgi:hypothetical protein